MQKVQKIQKIVSTIIMAIMVFSMLASTVFAAAAPDPSSFQGNADAAGVGQIGNLGNQIITIISTVGSIVSVIVLVVLGLKYMMGSAEEKAEYKKTLIPYIVGAALVFAASAIASLVFSFTSGLSGASGVK